MRSANRTRIGCHIAVLMVALNTALPVSADPLGDAAITQLFSDATAQFTLDRRPTNGWVSAQWKFQSDGSLSGYLFTSAYVADRKPIDGVDNGGWWVRNGRLCTQWSSWSDGQANCYIIQKAGELYNASESDGILGGDFTLIK